MRYIARQRRDEADLIKKIHKLAIHHSRYGYRRIAVLLRRGGWQVNRKRVHRIWKSEGLGLPRRRPKRRRVGPVGEIVNKAGYPNHVWSYDFVEDRTERGGKLRILAIIRRVYSGMPGHQGCTVDTGLGSSEGSRVVIPDACGTEAYSE